MLVETMSPLTAWNQATVQNLSEYLGEPDRIRALRLEALSRLKITPWPSSMDEAWRRNDPRRIGKERFKLWNVVQRNEETLPAAFPELTDKLSNATRLDLVNCDVQNRFVSPEHLESGLMIGSLRQAFQTRGVPAVEGMILDAPDDKESPAVSLLHIAFSQGGSYVVAPPRWTSPNPVIVRHQAVAEGGAILPLNLVKVGRDGELTMILDQSAISDEEFWFGAMTRIVVEDRARLNLLLVNRSSTSVAFYDHLHVRLGRDANLSVTWGDLTDGWTVSRREVALSGEGSEARLKGAYIGSGEGLLDLRTLQDHTAPSSTSDLMYKTALFGSSKSVYQGLIIVHPSAPNSNAYQLNRNLLMSAAARADSIPKLEIEVDEVRCTHGASAGKPDPNALFYLQSRGLSEAEAIRLVVEGFIAETGDGLKNEAVREYWREAVMGRAERILG